MLPINRWIQDYTRWLHTRWPAGEVEKLPEVGPDGTTAVPGVRVVGDLTGIPLLKFSSETAARAVRAVKDELAAGKPASGGVLDLVIVGGGVAGISAGLEARKAGLTFRIFEASEIFSTVVNFPRAKPIYTYPTEMTPRGGIQFTAQVKEALLDEMKAQAAPILEQVVTANVSHIEAGSGELVVHPVEGAPVRARRVILALGRSGSFRKLGVPGEDQDHVSNRLHDPRDFAGKDVVVVGGGDSALETAAALTICGARVTLSYRKPEFNRPKPENVEKILELVKSPSADVSVERPVSERVNAAATPAMRRGDESGSLRLAMATEVTAVTPTVVELTDANGQKSHVPAAAVFVMIGREAPLAFFRRSGIPITGEWTPGARVRFALFFLLCCFVYNWKSGGSLTQVFKTHGWFPFNVGSWFGTQDPATFLGTLRISMTEPGFYYSLAYTLCVVIFGIMRVRRRRTPYVKAQTLSLALIQVIPLFILPYLVLPLIGHNGGFDGGAGRHIADNLFPVTEGGHLREYWRSVGFILAWPLFIWNVFTPQPLWWWLWISLAQTFVLIPLMIWIWGKGAYCGWICSCGALAETLGDTHRHKMPHGPKWNRLNMVGQGILAIAFLLLALRLASWAFAGSGFAGVTEKLFWGITGGYYKVVDLFLAGIVGVGFYFWYSGRVWCRFACPLAALMHIYARFSRFRIFAEKKKCISCNVCTSVCHQGIDIMSFANKGLPMEDPECVRCSACVQQCPTGVLSFGRLDGAGRPKFDRLAASPVQMAEKKRE